MFKLFSKPLAKKLDSIEKSVVSAFAKNSEPEAWQALQPLIVLQETKKEAAIRLINILLEGYISIEHAGDALLAIKKSYSEDLEILPMLGRALEVTVDIDQLNAPAPDHPVMKETVSSLVALARNNRGHDVEENILSGLATAARLSGRTYDKVAEESCRRLIDLDPGASSYYYNYGLFLKTRGRFQEGMLANQKAREIASQTEESYEWNLGICATGAGEAETALKVWKKMGQKINIGRFGLPEGGYPQCKVRLAQRPLAERNADENDPGLEETIWIERLSPCHGVIRSVLFHDIGVNYGDVVLIDGAPITYHQYGDSNIPVFPHLATLIKMNYQVYDFVGSQDKPGQLNDISSDLSEDAIVYSHTENFQELCSTCWRDPTINHEHHAREETKITRGKIAAPKHIKAEQLLRQIDDTLAKNKDCHLFSPELCVAAGDPDRANIEKQRFEVLATE